MAVVKILVDEGGLHFYAGVAADTKPVYSTVPIGSSFWEVDTDLIYWAGATSWAAHYPVYALSSTLAMERNRGLANAYGAFVPEVNYTAFNPHTAAAVGTLTAGAAGATESVITASPCIVYGIEWASDTSAGSVLLYDKAALAGTSIPYPVLYNAAQQLHGPLGKKFNTGLTVIGTAAGVCCNVLWRLQ